MPIETLVKVSVITPRKGLECYEPECGNLATNLLVWPDGTQALLCDETMQKWGRRATEDEVASHDGEVLDLSGPTEVIAEVIGMTGGMAVPVGDKVVGIPNEAVGMLVGVEAKGAIPNGARFEKNRSEPDDMHAKGDRGTILGSHYIDPQAEGLEPMIGYFVEWDNMPGALGFVIGSKIKEVRDAPRPDAKLH